MSAIEASTLKPGDVVENYGYPAATFTILKIIEFSGGGNGEVIFAERGRYGIRRRSMTWRQFNRLRFLRWPRTGTP